MTATGRRGLTIGLLVVLALVGGALWYLRGSQRAADGAPAGPTVIAPAAPEQPAQPPGFDMPDGAAPEPLVSPPVTPAPQPGVAGLDAAGAGGEPEPAGDPIAVRGRVVWPGGTLPPDIDVTLYDADGSDLDYSTTDTEGNFVLRCADALLAGWSAGTDEVTLQQGGVVLTLPPVLVADLPARMPHDPPVVCELTLGYAPVLAGRVIDKVTGQPVADAEISAASTRAAFAYEQVDTLSGDDGTYALPLEGLPLQGLIAWCRHDEYQATVSGPLDLPPGATPGALAPLDFELEPPSALQGRVVDAGTGLPIEDATITVGSRFAAFADDSDWEISNEDGSFAIEAPEIPVNGAWLLVTADGYAPTAVESEGPWQYQEVRLGQAVTLAGTVTDGSGQPVVGAEVRVSFDGDTRDLDQGIFDETWTDDEGRFELLLEMVPVAGGVLFVDSGSHVPSEGRLGELARAVAGNRYEVAVSLASF